MVIAALSDCLQLQINFPKKMKIQNLYILPWFTFSVTFWFLEAYFSSILHALLKTFTFSAVSLLWYCGKEECMVVQTYYLVKGGYS